MVTSNAFCSPSKLCLRVYYLFVHLCHINSLWKLSVSFLAKIFRNIINLFTLIDINFYFRYVKWQMNSRKDGFNNTWYRYIINDGDITFYLYFCYSFYRNLSLRAKRQYLHFLFLVVCWPPTLCLWILIVFFSGSRDAY